MLSMTCPKNNRLFFGQKYGTLPLSVRRPSPNVSLGNTNCRSVLLELLDDVSRKLDTDLMILRLDGGYLSGDLLNTIGKLGLQVIIACRYDWILSQGVAR